MSRDRRSLAERFIDRFQLWPFYRKCRYNEETMAEIEDTNRMIREHYEPNRDEVQKSRNERKRENLKYEPVEKPRYLNGRERMAERSYNLEDLDFAIDVLCRGYRLPKSYRNHKLKGDMGGRMGCHVGYDRLLVYKYDGKKIILYTIDTIADEDIFD